MKGSYRYPKDITTDAVTRVGDMFYDALTANYFTAECVGNTETMATSKDKYLLVAGIDFGTTYSGYAYSFSSKKEDIVLNKNWGGQLGYQSNKTPTTILTKKNGQFLAFGYDAEEKFKNDDEDGGDGNKYLYRQFKMILHDKKAISMKSEVYSTTGHPALAIDIFTHALRYLKEHLLETLSKSEAKAIKPSMIRWVVTVPAIWADESKQFMREAAYRSGCISSKDSKQLIIALEPEAASFFCRQLNLANFSETKDIKFPCGTRYLVLDCGGGTNDMVVHEIVEGCQVKELCAVDGGPYGGTEIDKKFILLLEEILGKEFIQSFREECSEEWMDFITTFERAKKLVKPDGTHTIHLPVSMSMSEQYTIVNPGKNLSTEIKKFESRGITLKKGSISLSYKVVKSLFEDVIQNIIIGVKGLMQNLAGDGLDYIFMVGGFSENLLLQDAVMSAFKGQQCKVLIPSEAQLAIIKGAVLFGHRDNDVISRVSKLTYGCAISKPFDENIHDPAKIYDDTDGDIRCDGIFDTFVEKGADVEIGITKETTIRLLKKEKISRFTLYSINAKPSQLVQYIDEPGVVKLGEIVLDVSNTAGKAKREVKYQLTFGYTEIQAEAIEKSTGKSISATIDFLSDK